MRYFSRLLVILATLVSANVYAQGTPDFDRDVLRPIDTVPSRAWLEANFTDVRGQLERAAQDAARPVYERRRAITMLSKYPDARSRGVLEGLLADDDTDVRRLAVYTLGRGFGRQADERLIAQLEGAIFGDSAVVAEWAVRSLRWVHHPDAVRILRRVIGQKEARLASIASRALRMSAYAQQQR